MTNPELKRCPFCGGAPKVFPSTDREREVFGDAWTRIKCSNEECHVAPWAQVNCDSAHYEEAAAIWNTRTPDLEASIARLVEALRPFAKLADEYAGSADGHYCRPQATVGDLRRARQALSDHLQESASVER